MAPIWLDKAGTLEKIKSYLTQAGEQHCELVVFGEGEQTRDFVNVADVVQANLRAAGTAGVSGAFNIASGTRITINDLSARLAALVGGGSSPRPGEISLAHHGVLFLDELPEFKRPVLEVLREPLETGRITVSRAARQVEFPAQFQLLAAMNPCPCGYYGDSEKECTCSMTMVSPTGLARPKSLENHTRELEAFIQSRNLETHSGPIYAFFNPPWTLPFLRRNEVMIEIGR